MKKIITLILLLLPISIYAVSSSDVSYNIDDYIVDASIDAAGNMLVKEVIKIDGTYNGYIRELVYKNSNIQEFTGIDSDFEGSSIYNASDIIINKIGKIDYNKELDFNIFNEKITTFNECSNNNCYELSNINDGISIKMYNETIDNSTYFYIEYTLSNVVVIHNDIAEIYYNFIGDMFTDNINKYKLRLLLPTSTNEQIRLWAHGPLNGNVKFIKDESSNLYYGGYLEINDLNPNTPVDMRMTFPKELIMVELPSQKKTNIDALDKILKVEQERADIANKERENARKLVKLTYMTTGVYYISLIGLFIFIYLKYDKEYTTNFKGGYYREFIDDYDVTSVEYLINKKITDKSFSTSILNMIYKKNIKYEINGKNDYILIKLNEDNLNESEKIIMDMLFNKISKNGKVTLKEIKKYSSKIKGLNSEFLNSYNKWKNTTLESAKKENFYEKKTNIVIIGIIFYILSFLILTLQVKVGIKGLLILITFLSGIIFMIYLFAFQKRTRRGSEDYNKWMAFKRFLKDFGRFEEKDLPEITLWERYLVYASIFGISHELSKTMNLKLDQMKEYNNNDLLYDYILYSNLSNNINRCIHTSINTAQMKVNEARANEISSSSNSSGSGFGGGFSSGGGFGGGGGGGHGF